jgi:uncharacterized protein (TIGR01615 family)
MRAVAPNKGLLLSPTDQHTNSLSNHGHGSCMFDLDIGEEGGLMASTAECRSGVLYADPLPFETSEDGVRMRRMVSSSSASSSDVVRRIEQLTTHPVNMFHARLMRDVRSMYTRMMKDMEVGQDGRVDVVVLATELQSVGYCVSLRSTGVSNDGPPSGAAALPVANATMTMATNTSKKKKAPVNIFANLRNEFLVVVDSEKRGMIPQDQKQQQEEEYIIEMSFEDHFRMPLVEGMVDRYAQVVACVPQHVVAPTDVLTSVVEILCGEISSAFEECGWTLPPWRRQKALLSKWLNTKNRRDSKIEHPDGHGHADEHHTSPRAVVVSFDVPVLAPPDHTKTDGDGKESETGLLKKSLSFPVEDIEPPNKDMQLVSAIAMPPRETATKTRVIRVEQL